MKKGVFQSEIVALKDVAEDVFLMRLHLPHIAAVAQAGNFIELEITECFEAFWRRPISIHDADPDNGTIDLLVKSVGKATRVLQKMHVGQTLDVLGPLGNSFSLRPDTQKAIMVAGGIGIAPFSLLTRTLQAHHISPILFYGMGSATQACGIDFIKEVSEIVYTTMDGSLGEKGVITNPLLAYLAENDTAHTQIFACGPTPMLKGVQLIASEEDIPAQVSVETIMACGFGACVGCAVPLQNPQPGVKEFVLACKDGPVFNSREIIIDD